MINPFIIIPGNLLKSTVGLYKYIVSYESWGSKGPTNLIVNKNMPYLKPNCFFIYIGNFMWDFDRKDYPREKYCLILSDDGKTKYMVDEYTIKKWFQRIG